MRFYEIVDGVKKITKARIYTVTRKRLCSCCEQKKDTILIRHIKPEKKDTFICHECIVRMSLGQTIDMGKGVFYGKHSPKEIIKAAPRRPKKTAVTTTKVTCQFCGKLCGIQGFPNHVDAMHPEVKSKGLTAAEILLISPQVLEAPAANTDATEESNE